MLAKAQAPLVMSSLVAEDWGDIRAIYIEGIATGHATFEHNAPGWETWNASHLPFCRLGARRGAELIGWAALSPVSSRCVYVGVAEVSIYVATKARGQKVGTRLMKAFVEASEQAGIWTLQAGIFPENVASIELHKRAGFRIVGIRERLAYMDGRWRDVALLERRSSITGV